MPRKPIINVDLTDGSEDKPDLHTIYQRRNRTVKDFVNNNAIRSVAHFHEVISDLCKQYDISEGFYNEALGIVKAREEAAKVNEPKQKEPTTETPAELPKTKSTRRPRSGSKKKSTTSRTKKS